MALAILILLNRDMRLISGEDTMLSLQEVGWLACFIMAIAQ